MHTCKTIMVIGGLLSTGAAALFFQPWNSRAPQSAGAHDLEQHIAANGSVHKPAVRARPAGSRLGKALDKLAGQTEEDLPVALDRIATGWPKHELRPAIEGLFEARVADSKSELLFTCLVDRWSRLDPLSAADWAASLPEGSKRSDAISKVALVWNESSPMDAWSWALSLTPEPTRQATLLVLEYEITRVDPALAMERLSVIEDSQDKLRLLEHAVSNLAATDPDDALGRISRMSNPDERNQALSALAISWSESDPFAAATLAADAIAAGPDQNRAIVAVTQRWSQKDPDAARAWVGLFPDGPTKEDALHQIGQQVASAQELGPTPTTD